MSYSGAEPAELLAFRARLCGISTDAPSITGLSALMRSSSDPTIRQGFLQIWLADVQQSSDPLRLLALIFLANDAIQLLRASENDLNYRYSFVVPFSKAVLAVRHKAPHLVPKLERIISIFKERVIFDTQTLNCLQRVLHEDTESVQRSLLPGIQNESAEQRRARIQLLESESQQRHSIPVPQSKSLPPPPRPAPTPDPPRFIQPPSLDSLLQAGQALIQLSHRPQQCVNLDAEVVSRVRGYRVPKEAKIAPADSQFIESYRLILTEYRARISDIKEKIQRRKAEEEKASFLLIQQTGASRRVEVLLRKEWASRVHLCELEHAMYWKLMEFLEMLCNRWKRLQMVVESVDKESQRRNDAQKALGEPAIF